MPAAAPPSASVPKDEIASGPAFALASVALPEATVTTSLPTVFVTESMPAVASVVVKTAYMYAWGSLAFWAPRGAADVSQVAAQLAGEVTMPLDTLPRALRDVLVSAVPSGLFAWLPSRALLGVGTPSEVWFTPLAAAGLSALAVLLFLFGMRHYRQTGSRRYAGLGQSR